MRRSKSNICSFGPGHDPGAIVKNLTRLFRLKNTKGVDFPIKKSIIIIVKGMRLQVDSPMLAKGSNPAMDASKIPLDKNIKKQNKVLTK